MSMKLQRKLAAQVLDCSPHRIRFDPARTEEIKESITKVDIRSLVKDRAIYALGELGVSRGRARKNRVQKSKGQQRNAGSRKGRHTARLGRKTEWINRIRLQRSLLKRLREKNRVSNVNYRTLYGMCQAGHFRSERHLKLFIEENNLFEKTQ